MLREAFVALFSCTVATFQYAVALVKYIAERYRTWLRGPEPEPESAPSTPALTDASTISTISSYTSSED
jgi:hypothetical protein